MVHCYITTNLNLYGSEFKLLESTSIEDGAISGGVVNSSSASLSSLSLEELSAAASTFFDTILFTTGVAVDDSDESSAVDCDGGVTFHVTTISPTVSVLAGPSFGAAGCATVLGAFFADDPPAAPSVAAFSLPVVDAASSSESTSITVVFCSMISQSSSSSLLSSSGLRLFTRSPIITKSDSLVKPIFFTSSTHRSCSVLNRPIPYVIR
uniref:Uncharacterized protein n=1 Tax=Anopheles coluzzii TaxID=1518534 RepID=A0A8W7PHR4_ANOCL